MKWLFILNTINNKTGGVVSAPKIIRDGITDLYNVRLDILFFKEVNIWERFFKINLAQPKIIKVNNKSNSIEIKSISQLFFWLLKNRKNYNLFILHGIWPYIYVLTSSILLILKRPFCFHAHGALDPFDIKKNKKLFKKFLGFSIYRVLFNYSTGILFHSYFEAYYAKLFGAKTSKYIATLSSPNKNINNKFMDDDLNRIRKEYKIKDNQKIILFLNRIDEYKGLDILIKSLSNINFLELPLVLLIAGRCKKEYLNYIKNLIKDLKLEENIRVIGFVEGIRKIEIMHLSDLYILPSCKENFGISIVEALQNKLPVMITKEVYISDIIVKSKAGYICNRDPFDLSELIKKFFLEDKLINLDNCETCFKNNFSKDKCAKQHFKAYSEMALDS